MTLEFLTADNLDGARHGFFTRQGGASSGIFAGLNCGLGSSDQSDAVKLNRARVAKAIGVMPEYLCTVTQTHSADVVTLSDPIDGNHAPVADGLVTKTPGLALGVLTADCQPVLFSEPGAGVIGAAHAGWKGAASGVLEAVVDAMQDLGANRSAIHAAIGPTISQAAYEVGPEFFETIMAIDAANARFFANGTGDKYLFDLPSYGLARLRAAGVGTAEWIPHCTYHDSDRFYSYRRSTHRKEADYGRQISVIVL